jgi:Cu/Ag efflux protein CusF
MVPAVAAVLVGSGVSVSSAAPQAKAENAVKAVKSKSKTVSGAVALADANQVKLTTKEGDVLVNLVPTTQYYRVQSGVPVAEIKVGDVVKFALKSTDGMPTVQSLAPLTLKFGEDATLVFTKSDKMKFDRVSKIAATDLTVGQEAKVASNLFPDGKMEAREVWVTIPHPKAEKTTKDKPA